MAAQVAVRHERNGEAAAIAHVHELAFGRAEEALLVGALRAAGAATLSLVALADGTVAGHVLFSPVWIDSPGNSREAVGLGPLAVLPERQRQGIGSLLVARGLEELRRAGHEAVFVVGHPAYYPRFGFTSAAKFGLRWELPCEPESFMACELSPGALRNCPGIVRFRLEFAEL